MQKKSYAKIPFLPASHENKTYPGVFKKILFTHKDFLENGHVRMINWAFLSIGSSFTAHYHEDMEEVFIITTGKVKLCVENKQFILESGDSILIPAKSVHQMINFGQKDVNYIVIGISKKGIGNTVSVTNNKYYHAKIR